MTRTLISATVAVIFLQLLAFVHSEYVGENWPSNTATWNHQASSAWIIQNGGPTIPRQGHVHSFHARIKAAGVAIHMGIWKPTTDSFTLTLIGSQVFNTDSTMLSSASTEFVLRESIEVQAGDRIGFWQSGAVAGIARYNSPTNGKSFYYLPLVTPPVIGQTNVFISFSLSNYKFCLGVTLEDEPLSSVQNTSFSISSSTTPFFLETTTFLLPPERVHGNPELQGEIYSAASATKYVAVMFEFQPQIYEGYLNRYQIYSFRAGITMQLQIWRPINQRIADRQFFLVSQFEYTTTVNRAFENTTMINSPIDTGDLIGLTVVDGSVGIPIGWAGVGASGDRLYAAYNQFSKSNLPEKGGIYSNYQYVNSVNKFAIAAFVSDEIKFDENDNTTVPTTAPTMTTINTQSTTPITNEQVIGHPNLVGDSVTEDLIDFNPNEQITTVLTALIARRDGYITEIGFYSMANTLVDIGIYRRATNNRRFYTTMFLETIQTPPTTGHYVLNLTQDGGPGQEVQEGDALGFANHNQSTFGILRFGSGDGDSPYIAFGLSEVGAGRVYTSYLKGYDYAIYAILAEFVPTTTTTTTTPIPTTTTTASTTPTTTTIATTTPTTTTTASTTPTTTTTATTTPTTTTTASTTPTTTTTATTTPTTTTTASTTTSTASTTTTTTATTTTTTPTTTTTTPTTTTPIIFVTGAPGLKGEMGPRGDNGTVGTPGNQGEKGLAGFPGAKGDKGLPGSAGQDGVVGSTGATGLAGATGSTGANGTTGSNGSAGQQGATGATGPTGVIGAAGPTGAEGLQGETGSNGARGPDGQKGEKGINGVMGPVGDKGDQGIIGVKGAKGPDASVPQLATCSTDSCTSSQNSLCFSSELMNAECVCSSGYELRNESCVDIDECLTFNGMCQQICINSEGFFSCSCMAGYRLGLNTRICQDINECVEGSDNCTGGDQCFNEVGAFKCLSKSTPQAERLRIIEETVGGEDWWSLVILGLFIWSFILSIVLIIVFIIICCDQCTKSQSAETDSYIYGTY